MNAVDAPTISPLETSSFPLFDHQLIEASAGTGKTYTIANLYLRLLIGHGGSDSQAERRYMPHELLVVTFTEAATQELKQRIRKRIQVAQHAFVTHQAPADDPFLNTLLTDITHHDQAAYQLRVAERGMDEAAIFTIHGFCYRILSQHAFESSTPFNLSLLTDSDELWEQAVTDFWRKEFYALPRPLAKQVYSLWKTPQDLLKTLKPWFNYPILTLKTHPIDQLDERYQTYLAHITQFKKDWLEYYTEALHALKQSDFKAASYRHVAKWWDQVTLWAHSKIWNPPACLLKSFEKLLSYDDVFPPVLQSLMDKIHDFIQMPMTFHDLLIQKALIGIQAEITQLKKKSNQLTFDDLLTRLHSALNGPDKTQLACQIQTEFPLAIIDEFQDTDTLQYQIFKSIYPQNTRCHGLFMIGDPKQAIYAFRGANLFTYIQAKHLTHSRFTLLTNWRASLVMIQTCNVLFERHPAPFVYDQDIPFIPIDASPQAHKKSFLLHHKPDPAMTWFTLSDETDKPINKETYLTHMTNKTVNEIVSLLTLSRYGYCQLKEGDQTQPLQSQDIAILVRTNTQAKLIQSALTEQGIASVYLSERDNVFNTLEAKSLYRILKACCYPHDNEALLEALASSLLGYDAFKLDALKSNEAEWETLTEEFIDYAHRWNTQGIIACIRYILFNRNLPQQLLSKPTGERQLTDLSHLSELLATASQKECHHSPISLLNWLYEQIENPGSQAAFQLHLESDQNLIKIITYHKSKGLEYPIVFMPFICDSKLANNPYGYFFHDPKTYSPILDLTRQDASKALAEKEQLAEEVRLIYVGITRSIYKCYLGLAPIVDGRKRTQLTSDLHKTAIGRLLDIQTPLLASHWMQTLQTKWGNDPTLIQITPCFVQRLESNIPYYHEKISHKTTAHLSFNRSIERNWVVTSYTALTRQNTHPMPLSITESTPVVHPIQPSIFTFPKGAKSGVFLHYLLERLNFKKNQSQVDASIVLNALNRYGFDTDWLAVIQQLLQQVLNTPLHPAEFCLAELETDNQYVEMEFYMPIHFLAAKEFNQIIKTYDPLSKSTHFLNFSQLQGMIKGFIDLVCCHQGKYYIIDYKSNFLGDQPEDYQHESLSHAMIAHRYDVQYQLYTLAIHRLLKRKLPQYNYEQDIGGVLYLFLRGMPGKNNELSNQNTMPGVFFIKPAFALIDALDQLFSANLTSPHDKIC